MTLRLPYHVSTTVLPLSIASVDQMLDMACWSEAKGYIPEAYTYLADALRAEEALVDMVVAAHITKALSPEADYCDLGEPGCEDHLHSKAYHTADCWCGQTEASCLVESL